MANALNNLSAVRNTLLSSMLPAELDGLRPRLTRVRLVHGQILHDFNERIEQVFFVEQGVISLVAEVDGNATGVEVGVVGPEGAVGVAAVFDPTAISFNRAMVQIAGNGLRISASDLRDGMEDSPSLRSGLYRNLQMILAQSSQTAACNSRHTLPERCARWLLMAHDRVEGDELLLTQEFLAIMLAVRRSGVTVAMGSLQQAGLIRHSRGRVTITDRAGLEAAACDCHARVRAFSTALWGQQPPNVPDRTLPGE